MRGSLSWVASGIIEFLGGSSETYAPVWAHCRLTSYFTFLYVSGGGMDCVSWDTRSICVYHLSSVCVFSLGYSLAVE